MITRLDMLDQAFCVAAVVLLITLIWWQIRTNRNLSVLAPHRPNRLREDSIFLAVLSYMAAAVIASTVVQYGLNLRDHPLASLAIGSSAHLAGLAVCLLIVAKQFDGGLKNFWSTNGASRLNYLGLILIFTMIAAGLPMIVRDATAMLIVTISPGFEFPSHPTLLALHNQEHPLAMIAMIWSGALVIAPLAEEVFFRGLLQTYLFNLTGRRWAAIFMASLAFGMVHFTQPHVVVAITALGLILGYAYERTGSMLTPVLIHALFNLKSLIWDRLIS